MQGPLSSLRIKWFICNALDDDRNNVKFAVNVAIRHTFEPETFPKNPEKEEFSSKTSES